MPAPPYRIAPPPYHIAPRQSLGQSGSPACYRRYHTATIRPSRPSDDPPIHLPMVATILVIGNVPLRGVPATQHRCSGIPSRVLPYILKVSKDILIIRISGNQFVSQTRHHMATYPNITPYIWCWPTQDNAAGEHFGACTRPRDLN